MDRALALAWRGWGRVAPNPLVGAVVLQGERGGRRGLARRVRRACTPKRWRWPRPGSAARGATLVVTLEPCAHQGKQPPCTEALIARRGPPGRGRRAADPNPAAAGGPRGCGRRGSRWRSGVREDEARAQNAVFFHRWSAALAPAVRRAQARHLARWAHRRPCRPLALDLGRRGARLRALAPRRLRRDRRRWAHRAASTTPRSPSAARCSRAGRRAAWSSTAGASSRRRSPWCGRARETPDHAGDRSGAGPRPGSPSWRRRVSTDLPVASTWRRASRRCAAAGYRIAAGGGRRAAGRRAAGARAWWTATTGSSRPLWLGDSGIPAVAGLRRDHAGGGGALAGGRAPGAGAGHPAGGGSGRRCSPAS